MHIQWMPIPDKADVEAPYVTFISAEQLRRKKVTVLRAEDCYILDDQEIGKVRAGYVWPAERRPPGYYQRDDKSEVLLGNIDVRLLDGLWARAEGGTAATWAEARRLDDVIQFKNETSSGVDKVKLYKINRELMREVRQDRLHYKYRVVRRPAGRYLGYARDIIPPTEPLALEQDLVINSESHLHNTYWARIPEILGCVSDSLMIWKS
jgi:hypothetical protein